MVDYYKVSDERYRHLRRAERRDSKTIKESQYDWHIGAEVHAKVLHRFDAFQASITDIEVSDRPCPCGRSHYALNVTNGKIYSVCPLLYYQKRAQQIISKKGDLSWWAESQPLSKFLVRLPGAADATFVEEDQ